jgi:hypothetical protein
MRVGTLEECADAFLAPTHFHLLISHGELGLHLAVIYQGVAISHNNNRVQVVILPHTDSTSSPVGYHCSNALQVYLFTRFPYKLQKCVRLVCPCHRAQANCYC